MTAGRTMTYAGVGSRETPAPIIEKMTRYAERLAQLGYTLRSGAAAGADSAFEAGAVDRKEIYLPWDGFRGSTNGPARHPNNRDTFTIDDPTISDRAILMASFIHPNWGAVVRSRTAKFAVAAHSRNCAQVLGPDLEQPVDFLVCWAPPDGDSIKGGTRTAYELARSQNIPTYNLAIERERVAFEVHLQDLEQGRETPRTPTATQRIDTQRKAPASNEQSEPVRSFHGEYRFLSNFWPAKITYEGITYPTVEHAYAAAKTRDPQSRAMVAKLPTAGEAKRTGRTFTDREDWVRDDVRLGVMRDLLHLKFVPGSPLAQDLIATGARELIEENTWNDRFWGVDAKSGVGQNHLGKLLMTVRGELTRDQSQEAPARAQNVPTSPLHEISVGNVRDTSIDRETAVYIGRRNVSGGFLTASPLHNPFVVGQVGPDGRKIERGGAVALFADYLQKEIGADNAAITNELNRIADLAREKPITLLCWCAPAACHGSVVRETILERNQTRTQAAAIESSDRTTSMSSTPSSPKTLDEMIDSKLSKCIENKDASLLATVIDITTERKPSHEQTIIVQSLLHDYLIDAQTFGAAMKTGSFGKVFGEIDRAEKRQQTLWAERAAIQHTITSTYSFNDIGLDEDQLLILREAVQSGRADVHEIPNQEARGTLEKFIADLRAAEQLRSVAHDIAS